MKKIFLLLLLLFIYCPSKKGTKGTVDGVITKENKKEKKEEKEGHKHTLKIQTHDKRKLFITLIRTVTICITLI